MAILKKTFQLTKDQKDILRREFLKASQDKDFAKLINDLAIDSEVAMKYTSSLQRVVEEKRNSDNCNSLAECINETKGFRYSVKKEGDKLQFFLEACPYYTAEEYKENVKLFDLPRSLKNADLKDVYKTDKNRLAALKAINDFIKNYDNNPKGIFLSGSFGAGKTYLIAALFNEMAKKDVESVIVHTPELMRSLKDSFGSDYKERFYELKTTPLLLLDDIGAELVTQWSRDEVLSPILQYRMDQKLPTFFSSNFNFKDLEEHFKLNSSSLEKVNARRIVERIKEQSEFIELVSINLRG